MDDITYADYWFEVERIAKEVIEEHKEPENEDNFSDLITKHTGEHQWIIFYGPAFDVLKHSRNESYGLEEEIVDSHVKDFSQFISSMAFMAMYADIMDMVNHLGVLDKEETDV
jgi:hypothetical protein